MRLEIRRQAIELDPSAQSYIERRLMFALNRFAPRIQRVAVFLSDQNGPKGGSDKRCRLVLRLLGLGVITVEDQDAELTTLIDRAAERVARSVQRTLDRRSLTGATTRRATARVIPS